MFCRSIVIFRIILFWLGVTIYFGNVIFPCISFGVFDDFSGFGSAAFISVKFFSYWVYFSFFKVTVRNLIAFFFTFFVKQWPIVFFKVLAFGYMFFSFV